MGLPLNTYRWEAIYLFMKCMYTQSYGVYAGHNRKISKAKVISACLSFFFFFRKLTNNYNK